MSVTFNSDWLFGYLSRIVNGWRGGSAAAADGWVVCVCDLCVFGFGAFEKPFETKCAKR